MTNKYIYFIANWKMYGGLKSLNSLQKVAKFFISHKKNRLIKIIYCPPNTLIHLMSKNLKNLVLRSVLKIVMKVIIQVLLPDQ